MDPEQNLINERLKKLENLRKLGVEPYPYTYNQTHHATDILKTFDKIKGEEKSKEKVSLAGRITNLRVMGKASFGNILDETGKIQFYIREDEIGEKNYTIFNNLDLGDIIGIKGIVFRTHKGELSIGVKELTVLCKTMRPMPEKWHGLKDMEVRYRQRYLDLIANPEVRETFIKRSKIVNAVREFLNERGFLEVETPILQNIYGGASARPFKSFLHDLKMDIYLRIANELYLKRLIVGGYEKVYEIGKDFRNESIDRTHNPEFTQMECYWAYADYNDVMALTEDLYISVAKKVNGTTKIAFNGHTVDLKKPWKRITMKDALKQHTKIDIDKQDDEQLQELLRNYNVEYEGDFSRGLAIQLLFEELVEDKLIEPTFIIDHPKESTPLCKQKRGNKELVERFEPFICGMEIGNAYSELNDPLLQRKLLEDQAKQLRAGHEEAHPMDEDFIKSIEYGMPPTGGLGLGIDRMVMLLTGCSSIRDVILFPFMKPVEE